MRCWACLRRWRGVSGRSTGHRGVPPQTTTAGARWGGPPDHPEELLTSPCLRFHTGHDSDPSMVCMLFELLTTKAGESCGRKTGRPEDPGRKDSLGAWLIWAPRFHARPAFLFSVVLGADNASRLPVWRLTPDFLQCPPAGRLVGCRRALGQPVDPDLSEPVGSLYEQGPSIGRSIPCTRCQRPLKRSAGRCSCLALKTGLSPVSSRAAILP